MRGAIDAAVTEPLLSGRLPAGVLPTTAPAAAAATGSAGSAGGRAGRHAGANPAPGLNFRHHFRSVVLLLRPYLALLLALIAVGEALVVAQGGWVQLPPRAAHAHLQLKQAHCMPIHFERSKLPVICRCNKSPCARPSRPPPAVGKVAGSFYRIVIDRQPASLAAMLLHAAALYAASTALYAAACWVTGESWCRAL